VRGSGDEFLEAEVGSAGSTPTQTDADAMTAAKITRPNRPKAEGG
jgi:hypothetical protein